MPDEHKTLEQRIADIGFNLKKLREEITNAYISWEGKIVLEQSPKQPPDNQSKHRPNRRKSRNLFRPGGGNKPSGSDDQRDDQNGLSRLWP
jgi:hypothetical protein